MPSALAASSLKRLISKAGHKAGFQVASKKIDNPHGWARYIYKIDCGKEQRIIFLHKKDGSNLVWYSDKFWKEKKTILWQQIKDEIREICENRDESVRSNFIHFLLPYSQEEATQNNVTFDKLLWLTGWKPIRFLEWIADLVLDKQITIQDEFFWLTEPPKHKFNPWKIRAYRRFGVPYHAIYEPLDYTMTKCNHVIQTPSSPIRIIGELPIKQAL